jgi:leucine-rich repeat protein SHOC2
MEQTALERKIARFSKNKCTELFLSNEQIATLPDTIGSLSNLTYLNLSGNQLTILPDTIGDLSSLSGLQLSQNNLIELPSNLGNLSCLSYLNLRDNQLTRLSENICKLQHLSRLDLSNNQLSELPESISELTKLTELSLSGNPLTDLSALQNMFRLKVVWFLNTGLSSRYWTKLSDWKSEWLLDEENAEARRALIQQLGYEKICKELNAINIDSWKEYTLLKIDGIETVYAYHKELIDSPEATLREREPMVLLKMTCPSTQHIHILRVPPEMTSAEAAITWVNHGIHPDKFAVQT